MGLSLLALILLGLFFPLTGLFGLHRHEFRHVGRDGGVPASELCINPVKIVIELLFISRHLITFTA
jgi:hypothetical protein